MARKSNNTNSHKHLTRTRKHKTMRKGGGKDVIDQSGLKPSGQIIWVAALLVLLLLFFYYFNEMVLCLLIL